MKALLTIRNVRYQRDRRDLLQDLNLTVYPGELAAVYGGVNSGKSALADLITGFAKPRQGQISRAAEVAVVTQQFIGYPDLTVRENIEFCAAINDFPEAGLTEIIQATGLAAWQEHRAGRIPKALQAMLQLACALARNYDLLILDDTATGLDTELKNIFWRLIGQLRDQGKGIILMTGLWEDAKRCDYILTLPSGAISPAAAAPAGPAANEAGGFDNSPAIRAGVPAQASDGATGSVEVIL